MSAVNKRQVIILAALAIPIIGLMVLSFMGPQKAPPPPKVAGNQGNATGKPGNKVVLPTLEEMRANIKSRWTEAEAMTQEKYAALYRKDPRLPQTLELYRARIKSRMHQLQNMTQEQFEAEQRQRTDHLRQRGIVAAPRAPGSTAAPKSLIQPAQPAAVPPVTPPTSAATR